MLASVTSPRVSQPPTRRQRRETVPFWTPSCTGGTSSPQLGRRGCEAAAGSGPGWAPPSCRAGARGSRRGRRGAARRRTRRPRRRAPPPKRRRSIVVPVDDAEVVDDEDGRGPRQARGRRLEVARVAVVRDVQRRAVPDEQRRHAAVRLAVVHLVHRLVQPRPVRTHAPRGWPGAYVARRSCGVHPLCRCRGERSPKVRAAFLDEDAKLHSIRGVS